MKFMKSENFNETNILKGVGYHFLRFRKNGRHALRLWRPGEFAAEKKRRLKLMALYYMGVLLMFVGFLICFNAIFRNPDVAKPTPGAVTRDAEIERARFD
jgi:hypothetical protein